MAAILSGMVEGVVVVNEVGQVQLVNDAARRMLRLDASAEGRRYVELIRHPDIAAQVGRALKGETPDGLELSPGHDRTLTLVARAAPAATPTGSGAVLVLHDITDLRRADRVRRDFVANVSHELRTPLTAIRGYVEALLDSPPPPEDAPRFLGIIARHSERMERLVKDLLRLARLDAGQEVLDRASCSVEAMFAGVVAELEPIIEARGQSVRTTIGLDAHMVEGDPLKLHDVLKNLVENASNYSPERSVILLQSSVEDGLISVRVLDQGPGIPEADLQRIFERFYRVDKARSRETGGTGLGLSIVRHLVELHGGDVRAANRPCGGAVFTVRLPKAG
jgi:two-component system phosphate regulon sensor histidine kinase PhoR